jgi:hypothetical protein
VVFITGMPDERHEDEKFILNAMDEFSEGTIRGGGVVLYSWR